MWVKKWEAVDVAPHSALHTQKWNPKIQVSHRLPPTTAPTMMSSTTSNSDAAAASIQLGWLLATPYSIHQQHQSEPTGPLIQQQLYIIALLLGGGGMVLLTSVWYMIGVWCSPSLAGWWMKTVHLELEPPTATVSSVECRVSRMTWIGLRCGYWCCFCAVPSGSITEISNIRISIRPINLEWILPDRIYSSV